MADYRRLIFAAILSNQIGRLIRRAVVDGGWEANRAGSRYWLIVMAELILLVAAFVGLNAIDRPHGLPGVLAMLIGLNFIPLSRLYHRPTYRGVAGGMVAVGLITVVLVLLNSVTWNWWLIIPGIGSALIMWTDAALALLYPWVSAGMARAKPSIG